MEIQTVYILSGFRKSLPISQIQRFVFCNIYRRTWRGASYLWVVCGERFEQCRWWSPRICVCLSPLILSLKVYSTNKVDPSNRECTWQWFAVVCVWYMGINIYIFICCIFGLTLSHSQRGDRPSLCESARNANINLALFLTKTSTLYHMDLIVS